MESEELMIFKQGRFEFRYNQKEHDMSTQESHIRTAPQPTPTSTDVNDDRVVKAATTIIKTYFVWKMADRVVAKVLK